MSHRRGGINRALTWIKKTLEITEVSNVPAAVLDDVNATLDLFGWERLPQAQILQVSNPLANFANSAVGPDDVTRLILAASARHSDIINHELWVEKNPAGGVVRVALNAPVNVAAETDAGITRPTFLNPGDFLRARTEAAVGAGSVVITIYFIDLPIGEYMPPVW